MEDHFLNKHWRSRKKLDTAVDWSCRMCNNGNRRFGGWREAVRHAELHQAGLIVSNKYNEDSEDESDTTSGGFSSGHDCVSSEEGESDLSSVSERETEDSEMNEDEKDSSPS